MAASSAAGLVDPTKQEKFPVVLSDALQGKVSKEVLTGVRYNHKPTLSSDVAPSSAKIKPAGSSSYDLSFQDNGGKYTYSGTRSSKDGQYVLVFDPDRRVFVLHQMDSVFNMNLTRTPSNNDAKSLEEEFPHIENIKLSPEPRNTQENITPSKVGVKSKQAPTSKSAAPLRSSAAKKQAEKPKAPVPLTLPEGDASKPAAAQTKNKNRRPVESEESDSDDDDAGGLQIEYPEGPAPSSFSLQNDFSPAFPSPALQMRRFSEFARGGEEGEEEDQDADGEDGSDAGSDENAEADEFKLPSPVNNRTAGHVAPMQPEEEEEDDAFDDIEAELEKEFMDDESEVSEED